MEIGFIILLLAAVFLLLQYKKHSGADKPTEQISHNPLPEDSGIPELHRRLGEFLEQDRFFLLIQPVMDFSTNTACHGEVLARLNHPEQGIVFPDTFLPGIDALGLYPVFDRYIFQKCCAFMSRSEADGGCIACLSCNFSRKTLSGDSIAEDLARIADEYGIPHQKLAIEITEREFATDQQQLIRNLHRLRQAGFRIILDDYGYGVTSAMDLLQFPLDIVKLDRSLLLNAETPQGEEVYRATVTMAIQLGAEVVCEGIETREQNHFARDAGCHYGQGYFFFSPVSQDEVHERIRKSSILS